MEYQKRPGTSGVEGQLFETKLLSLVLLRLLNDERVKEFCLATNMDGIGAFDDICLKISIVGYDLPIALFIQQKHKEHDDAFVTINKDKADVIKYINSYLLVKDKINSLKDQDHIFYQNMSVTNSVFILYTNAEFKLTNSVLNAEELHNPFVSSHDTIVNDLLATSSTLGRQLRCPEQLVKNIAHNKLEADLVLLAERFAAYLIDKPDSVHNIMNDEYMRQYHVVLKRKVVDVSDIKTDNNNLKWRNLTFRHDFFNSLVGEQIELFRSQLFKEILRKHPKINSKMSDYVAHDQSAPDTLVDELIYVFLSSVSAVTLSPLIGIYVAYKEGGQLDFLVNRPQQEVEQLRQINISQGTATEALLRSLKVKVHIAFGNVDMLVSGGPKKVERRLEHLASSVINFCQQSEPQKVVTIQDTLEGGLLNHNGGLASGVDNILIWDENTKMLKLANEFSPEQNNAQALWRILEEKVEKEKKINNLYEYRFNVKTDKFPKLRLDCTDIAREFLSKLVIYEKQSKQSMLDKILINEIHNLLNNKPHLVSNESHSVFLHFHEEIVNWWMQKSGTYLNKTNIFYERAISNIQAEPQISAFHTTFHTNNSKLFEYSFSGEATKWMKLQALPIKLLIVTETVTLTTIKVIRCLRNHYTINKYAVLDLECVINSPTASFSSLDTELRKTEKVLIIVWHNIENNNSHIRLYEFAQATKDKQLIVIANNRFIEKVNEYFSCERYTYKDTSQNLTSMTTDSQREIMRDTKIIFQGQEVSMDLFLDDISVKFIKGAVLDKIIRKETINIGDVLSNSRYEEIKHLYIDRRVSSVDQADSYDNHYLIRTFHDICQDVLISAAPGVGKSTLLTRLSLNTKKCDINLWIVRVNFIDYYKQFDKWYTQRTAIDPVEALTFLYRVALKNINLPGNIVMTRKTARLVDFEGDELLAFELNVFLYFYNRKKVIFVFDGFDEICPYYKDKVVSFLRVVKYSLLKSTMWVTSRPYSDILPDLQHVLGRGFKIENLDDKEQETYLKRFWEEKIIIDKLKNTQLENLLSFIHNATYSMSEARVWICRVCFRFLDTICPLVYESQTDDANKHRVRTIHESLWEKIQEPERNTLSGIPLILYFVAEYFLNIIYSDGNHSKSNLGINLCDIYKMFIENKLTKIFFQEKNDMDISNPSTRRICEQEMNHCISTHKKLAAHALFHDPIFTKLEFEEFKNAEPLDEEELKIELNKIRTGADKAGLISYVTVDGVPVFIHRSFTEYFAAEYACDILKSRKFNVSQKTFWYCAINEYCGNGVREWIDTNKKIDTSLQKVLKELTETSPIYASQYRVYFDRKNMSMSQYIRILASSVKDYQNNCFDKFGETFLSNYWKYIDRGVQLKLFQYLESYFISKMKPHLQRYFMGPIVFLVINNSLYKDIFAIGNKNIERIVYDVLLKIKIGGCNRSVPLLMRLEDNDSDHTLETRHHETKISNSSSNMNNKEKSEDLDGVLILYNNNEFDVNLNIEIETIYNIEFNKLLTATGTVRHRLCYSEQQVEYIGKKILEKELALLAVQLVPYLWNRTNQLQPQATPIGDLIQKYYVVLKENVISVSYIPTGEYKPHLKWYSVTFRDNFFDTDNNGISSLRNYFLQEILGTGRVDPIEDLTPDALISSFFSEPSATTLTPLIGAYIVQYEDGQLNFLVNRPPSEVKQLGELYVPASIIDEAILTVRKVTTEYLRSVHIKVSLASPDDVMAILVDPEESEWTLDYFVTSIAELCSQYKQLDSYKIVTIDDNVNNVLLSNFNKCLARYFWNILIHDNETDMLKFANANNFTRAPSTNSFLIKLSKKLVNLNEYRFVVRTKAFPIFNLNCTNIAREFLSRLAIYADQESRYELEDILENDKIINLYPVKSLVKSDLMLLYYHKQVLELWYSQRIDDETNNLYKQAVGNITTEPQINALFTIFYLNHLKYLTSNVGKGNTNWMNILKFSSRKALITYTVLVTTMDMLQALRENDSINNYVILDLQYIYNTSDKTRNLLCAELKNTERVVIIVWYNSQQNRDYSKLYELEEATRKKHILFIANEESRETIKEYFSCTNDVFEYETESLVRTELRTKILNNGKIVLQGREVSLDLILDDELLKFAKDYLLDNIIRNENISIGTPFSDRRYDEIKDMYIKRRVIASDNAGDVRLINTFHDIPDDIVLLTAPPGVGKSTLLTHLSINTLEQDMTLWIVRINFIDHMELFNRWQSLRTIIDTTVAFMFVCQVVLKNEDVSFKITIKNDEVSLVRCAGSNLHTFMLKLFIHFYNRRRLIFVFDGFDEISPLYKDTVLKFLTVASTNFRKNKMWVTSRPYGDVLPDLNRVLGRGFELENVDDKETYVRSVTREKQIMDMLDNNKLGYLQMFIDKVLQLTARSTFRYLRHSETDGIDPRGILPPARPPFRYLRHSETDGRNPGEVNNILTYSQRIPHTEVHKLFGTELLLYFIADYLIANVLDTAEDLREPELKLDIRLVCQMYTEHIKRIIFQDKYNIGQSDTSRYGPPVKRFKRMYHIFKKSFREDD